MSKHASSSKKWLVVFLGTLVGAARAAGPAPAVTSDALAISTGSTSGVYYKAAQAMCALLAKSTPQLAATCTALPTAGSVTNLNRLRAGQDSLAIVQSDIQFQAWGGTGQFNKVGAFSDLRSLFSMHPETVTVLVRPHLNISRIEGLAGLRFGAGSPGSGSRLASDQLLAALAWDRRKFAVLSAASPTEAGEQLCKGSLDAFLVVVGHPSDQVRAPIEKCGARLLPVTGAAVDALLRDSRYLVRSAIPGSVYAGHPQPILSYGPLAVLVATAHTSTDVVYTLVKTVFDNLDEFTRQNASLADLNAGDMIRAGLTAPLHDGAIRYYRERGWIK